MVLIRRCRRILAFLAGFCLLASCKPDAVTPAAGCGSGAESSSHPKAAAYQAVLNQYVRRGLPGISVSVKDSLGEWTGTAGKADIARNVPMQPCHLAKVASITKMCVATLALMLVEEGTLSLDDPITAWLPGEVTDRLPNANRITLLHLLSHKTGLYNFINDDAFYLSIINDPNRTWTGPQLLELVYGKPAAFYPGTRAAYSNANTVLVSMVIERATGRKHAELLRERIFRPLGMHDTYYYGHDKLPANRVAQGYLNGYGDNTLSNVSNYNFGDGNGHAGLLATVADLQLFINALFVQKTLLSQSSLDRMTQFSPSPSPDLQLGVGIFKEFLNKGPRGYGYGHNGSDLGYSADLYWFPEKKASLALLVNCGTDRNSTLGPVFRSFRTELADRIVE